MGLKDQYDFSLLVNEAEEVVIEELEKQFAAEKFKNICKCEDCTMDMAALSLNKLEPEYRSSFTGVIYAQRLHTGTYKEKVEKIVTDAIEKISKNPSHS